MRYIISSFQNAARRKINFASAVTACGCRPPGMACFRTRLGLNAQAPSRLTQSDYATNDGDFMANLNYFLSIYSCFTICFHYMLSIPPYYRIILHQIINDEILAVPQWLVVMYQWSTQIALQIINWYRCTRITTLQLCSYSALIVTLSRSTYRMKHVSPVL